MTAPELLAELESAGVLVWEESGQLRFRAPKGVMTEARRQTLRDAKDDVLAYLRAGAPEWTVVADPDHRGDPFPLTDVQAAYALGRRDAFDDGGPCQLYLELALPPVEPERIEAAWRRLVARHDMLRAVVRAEGYQHVLGEVPPYRIAVADLRGAGDAQRDAAIGAVRAEMDHRLYDAETWPLFELRVTRCDARTVLHVSFDFLIADYLSILLLLGELRTLTFAPETELPPLEVTFRDYVLAERRRRAGPRYARDRDYWMARVDELPPAPELPLAEPAPSARRTRFTRRQVVLAPDEWAALRGRAAAEMLTPSGAVLAAYAEVIARWSRRPRFSLNLTLVNREPVHPQAGALVGDFTSVALLAVDRGGAGSFAEHARALQTQLWEDMDHRLCTGVEVVREIAERRGRAAALMPIVFTGAIGQGEPDALARRGEFAYGLSQTPQVWIDCQAVETGGGLTVLWDVREGVFPDGVSDDMAEAMGALLRALASGEDAWRSASPVELPPAQRERRRLVNATAAPLREALLHDGAVAQALRAPDRLAVVTPRRALTYAELLARAAGVAEALRARTEPGEIVAVVMDKGWEQVVAVLGILLAGGVYLPVDTNQPPVRRAQLLEDAGVRHALTQSRLLGAPWPDGVQALAVDALDPAPSFAPPPSRARPDDLAYVIYTSGSTGKPKGVMIAHRSAVNTVDDVTRRFGIGADDRVLGLAQLGFDLSVYDVFGLLAVGGALVLPDPERRADPSHWAELIETLGVTLWNTVPAQLQMLQQYLDAEPAIALPSLRLALLSGDWIPVTLPGEIRRRLPGLRLVSLGGATEAAIWSIFHPIDDVARTWRSIPYGKPLDNQTFHVLDAALMPCPEWVAGELYIGGAGVAIGYLGDAAKTAERFVTHPRSGERLYRTGDFGRYLPDGNIEFLGREDRQVKLRGHRVELAEIEAALVSHPAVGAASVLLDAQRPADPRIVAFVEPAAATRVPDDGADLVAAAAAAGAAAVAGADVPAFLEFARRLDRAALLSMLEALCGAGLFATKRDAHRADEIVAALGATPRRARLVRRWLGALAAEGMLALDAAGARCARLVTLEPGGAAAAWDFVERMAREVDYDPRLVRYLRASAERLGALVRDEVDPLQLLFPAGDTAIAHAAYRDNLISRYTNAVAAETVRRIASAHAGAGLLRVLEVGAGIGGTSASVIPALDGLGAEYAFTDLSPFFLTAARERFGAHPWVSYGLLDLDADYRAQGFAPNTFDVVVAGDVLHAARDVTAALGRLRELLRPGGRLVFVEMTRDHYAFLASLEFLLVLGADGLGDFTDLRRGQNRTFLTREQWDDVLAHAGAHMSLALPEPSDPLAKIGMHVFAARVKADRAALSAAEIGPYLADRLPRFMLPAYAEVVDALPLTPNGKVDQKMLRAWLPSAAAERDAAVDEPRTELEGALAALWSDGLGRDMLVGRAQSLFELGGDSLVISRLAGRMRAEIAGARDVPFDGLLRQMLQEPTVAAVAAFLETHATLQPEPAAVREDVAIVELRGAPAGAPVTVVGCDATGMPALSGDELAALAPDGAVLGLQYDGAGEDGGADFVGELADRAVRALLAEARVPSYVAGAGLGGGVLALEIARRLGEAGCAVQLVVYGDERVVHGIGDELLLEYVFARALGADPSRLGFPAEDALAEAAATVLVQTPNGIAAGALAALAEPALQPVADAFARLAKRTPEKRTELLQRVLASRDDPPSADELARRFAVFRRLFLALAAYEPDAYAGDVTLLSRPDAPRALPWLRDDAQAFWNGVALGDVRAGDGVAAGAR